MILLAGVLVGIGRVAAVGITSTVMNPLVPELVAIVVAIGRERERYILSIKLLLARYLPPTPRSCTDSEQYMFRCTACSLMPLILNKHTQ